IAEIKRGYTDPPAVKVHHQGKEVIALGVSMVKGGDIIELGKSLVKLSDSVKMKLPAGIKLVQIQDQPKAVSSSVNEFVKVLIAAVGFLPSVLAKSTTGEYTFAIFAVTVIALVLSWIVSVYFVPYLGTLLLKPPPGRPKAATAPLGGSEENAVASVGVNILP